MEFKKQTGQFFSSVTLLKILIFSALVFVMATLQSSFFSSVSFFPASPDLILATVIGLGVYDGEKSGAIAGIGGGVLAEAFGAGGDIMLLPVFYMLVGFFFGIVARIFLNKNLLSWLVYMLIASTLRGMLSLVHTVISESDINLFLIFRDIIVPEFTMTVIFALPIFFIVRLCARPFHKKIEMD